MRRTVEYDQIDLEFYSWDQIMKNGFCKFLLYTLMLCSDYSWWLTEMIITASHATPTQIL